MPEIPVLRKISYPLADTFLLPADVPLNRHHAFSDNKYFEDRTEKTSADTNMTQSGQLGCPLEYDLNRIELHFEQYDSPEQARFILQHMEFVWFFGSNTPWLRLSGASWRPLMEGFFLPIGDANARQIAEEMKKRGNFWPHYWHPIGPTDRPRRIHSTESFRAELHFKEPIRLKSPVRIKAVMQDTLYANL